MSREPDRMERLSNCLVKLASHRGVIAVLVALAIVFLTMTALVLSLKV